MEDRQMDWFLIEKRLKPIFDATLRSCKRKISFKIFDDDEMLQEGRLALFRALKNYNSEKGTLESFAYTVLKKTYTDIVKYKINRKRMPRKSFFWGSEWHSTITYTESFLFLDVMEKESEFLTPYDELLEKEKNDLIEKLKFQVYSCLSNKDKQVFECFFYPSKELLRIIKSDVKKPTEIKISHIEKFLNFKRNSINYSIRKIKRIFSELSNNDEFRDLVYA
jgi:DNA-directed RNA polymerase specialized sigma subunit